MIGMLFEQSKAKFWIRLILQSFQDGFDVLPDGLFPVGISQ